MLGDENMKKSCLNDGRKRANGTADEISDGIQMCHAGMLNRRSISQLPGIGTVTILYGSKYVVGSVPEERRMELFKRRKSTDPEFVEEIYRLLPKHTSDESFDRHSIELIDVISSVVEELFKSMIGFHWAAINMAHELSNVLLGMGFMAKDLEESLKGSTADEFVELYSPILSECQLGVFLVRNFLSYFSETKYKEAVEVKFSEIDLQDIVVEITRLHSRTAEAEDVGIVIEEDFSTPPIFGDESEIRRAVHNVILNAIKYSYHSTEKKRREIRIWKKVPYNPGFGGNPPTFSIAFENYGLGVDDEELANIGVAGFRGKQAMKEVPIGSGIGLSEVKKILKSHGGRFKLSSKALHKDDDGHTTYLTRVELIFPYDRKRWNE
jgi:signal transduction histidine kinase